MSVFNTTTIRLTPQLFPMKKNTHAAKRQDEQERKQKGPKSLRNKQSA